MFCNGCGGEIPDNAKFCVHCGAKVPDLKTAKPAFLSVDGGSVVKVDEMRVEQHIHEAPNPSLRQQATMTGMICPVCHQVVVGADWFRCPKCDRKYIHRAHQDPATFLCSECAAKARRLASEVREGDVLGERYEIRRLLGQGGMGQVFLGFDRELQDEFALKFLPPEIVHSPSAMADLQREAQILLKLAHDNLVRFCDLVNVESLRFLKMEYVDGPSLDTVLAEANAGGQRLSVETVVAYAKQILDGLAYLHARKVIHRDLKPANLMLTSRGVVKIMDFGIAQLVRDTLSRVSNRPTTGTLVYMSPEQLLGKALDPRSDLYSLGCVLYELLSGLPPFHSGDIYQQHIHETPDPIEGLPAHVNGAILKALAKPADQRFASAAEFFRGLAEPPRPAAQPAPKAAPQPLRPEAAPPKQTVKPDCITNSIGMTLQLIPAGRFRMGSEKGEDKEKPVHAVTISKPFYLGIHQVTHAQYERVMKANPSGIKGANRPVETVSWNAAVEFCRELSKLEGRVYRLPTEAEWEYACRAGSTTEYCFGDDETKLGEYAWFVGNSGGETHDVGQKKPNAWGLFDMHGNVWEWCEDVSHDDYAGAPSDGSAWRQGGRQGLRVLRGGSWTYVPTYCRSAARAGIVPPYGYSPGGARVVLRDF